MDVKDRIKELMNSKRMSQQDFANALGITPGSLSGILNERTKPTNNHTQAVHRAFPEVNINWLLFGEGNMYKDESVEGDAGMSDGYGSSTEPSLFSSINGQAVSSSPVARTESPQPYGMGQYLQSLKNAQEVAVRKRQIREIRVFFDDGTYETFVLKE